MANFKKNFKFLKYDTWEHHRSGWNFCIQKMKQNFENEDGTAFYPNRLWEKLTSRDEMFDWVGFYHVTPYCVDDFLKKNDINLVNQNLKSCKGLYVLSNYTKKFVEKVYNVPVEVIYYATESSSIKFNIDNFTKTQAKILFIGSWLRKYDIFEAININYEKVYLGTNRTHKNVTNYKYLSATEYDDLLSKNIVFLDFIDSSCNTAIIECIERNTPIICPKSEPNIEYLGSDYPLFFKDKDEAEYKIRNIEFIKSAYNYLKNMNKDKININTFINSIGNSKIYKSLNKQIKFI